MTSRGAEPGPGPEAPRAATSGLRSPTLQRGLVAPGAVLAGADLRGFDLTAADLAGADLRGADLRGADLHGARLRGAVLDGARLAAVRASDVDLESASLVGADLEGAALSGAILLDADLTRARLRGAVLQRADLRDAVLAQADLTGADLGRATLAGAELTGALLDGVTWRRTHLRDATGLSEADRQALLAAGAWEGVVVPELGPLVGLGARIAAPAAHWAQGQGLRLRARARGWWAERVEARRGRLDQQREQQRRRRLADLPGGPGADLSGQDFSGRQLQQVDWSGANLERTRLEGAHLQEADLSGARASAADLSGARLAGARLASLQGHRLRLVDADLRRVDLAGADLSAADLTGADLRGATLAGTDLTGADLTAARLADLDLSRARLDGAVLDQADLTGADLRGASVAGADLRGALGLSPGQRQHLAEAGARTADDSLRELARRVRPRHLVAAAGVLALGLGSYGAARWLGPGVTGDDLATASMVRELPPDQALARFEELAEEAERDQDRVTWLLEAAGQARRLEDAEAEERLLRAALATAGEDVEQGAEVRLTLATRLAERDQAEAAMALVDPLLDLSRQTPEQRARAVLLYQELGTTLGVDTQPRLAAVLDSLATLPDAAAELHLALASALSSAGRFEEALAQVDAADARQVSASTGARILEARARVLEYSGDLEAAAAAWRVMADGVEAGTAAQHAALLALADVRERQGATEEATTLLLPLLEAGIDPRVRTRAWLVRARMHEDADDVVAAAGAYREAIELATADPELAEQARLALARLVSGADQAGLEGVLAQLDPEARALVAVQATLGEARTLIEDGRPDQAREIYEQLLERDDLDAVTRRDARTGLGEALAREGMVAEALVVWRDLLGETARQEDRIHLQLRIAEGLLTGGRLDEAVETYGALAQHSDPDIAVQGRLGLAQVALVRGERERARVALQGVADDARDPAWRVRALEELADMAAQDGQADEALARWREVLAAVPPGHAAAGRARLAVVTTLSASGRIDEARSTCRQAIAGATSRPDRLQARLTCAELDERLGDGEAALAGYRQAAEDAGSGPEAIAVDASTGAARVALALGRPAEALAAAEGGLAVAREASARLLLLDLQVQALQAAGRDATAAREARDALMADAPQAAVGVLVEAAHQARAQGRTDDALALLARARDAAPGPALRAGVLLELADVQLEAGLLDEAAATYAQASDDQPGDQALAFQAGMGRAEVLRRQGDPAGAAAALAGLSAPDAVGARWLAEARARALSEAGDPGAVDAWEALATIADDDAEAAATAAMGKADALFAADRYAEALPLYEQAAALAPDRALAGWAALGAANARAALDEPAAAAAFEALAAHPDPEVALQAAVRRSQLAAEAEEWDAALAALRGVQAQQMGPAWDTTVVQARAAALAGAGRGEEARTELAGLQERWPGEEEAQLPALLTLAELARRDGDLETARARVRQALDLAQDPGFRAQAEALGASLAPE